MQKKIVTFKTNAKLNLDSYTDLRVKNFEKCHNNRHGWDLYFLTFCALLYRRIPFIRMEVIRIIHVRPGR